MGQHGLAFGTLMFVAYSGPYFAPSGFIRGGLCQQRLSHLEDGQSSNLFQVPARLGISTFSEPGSLGGCVYLIPLSNDCGSGPMATPCDVNSPVPRTLPANNYLSNKYLRHVRPWCIDIDYYIGR